MIAVVCLNLLVCPVFTELNWNMLHLQNMQQLVLHSIIALIIRCSISITLHCIMLTFMFISCKYIFSLHHLAKPQAHKTNVVFYFTHTQHCQKHSELNYHIASFSSWLGVVHDQNFKTRALQRLHFYLSQCTVDSVAVDQLLLLGGLDRRWQRRSTEKESPTAKVANGRNIFQKGIKAR